jgi:tetratricopeptide (TPR) repeat protein
MLSKIDINPQRQILIVYIVLIVVTLAVFWQVNHYDFVNIDDSIYVTENNHIHSGITLDGFRWAFGTKYYDLWNPLIWLSFMFDYQLFGLNAGGYHLTNVILHIMSTLLLFWLFNRMTGAIWKSAFVAALFALHPLHVESVAWISERKDVLSAFFWMLTLCLYVYYTEKPVIKRYLPVLLCFACALMSKPMVVTLPIVMILLDYWPLRRLQSRKIGAYLTNVIPVSTNQGKQETNLEKGEIKENISLPNDQKLTETKIAGIIPLWQLREKIPFFVLSAVLAIITFYPSDKPSPKLFFLGSRITNALISFATYLEKIFWPHDLAVFYPFSDQFPVWQVLGAALLIFVISAVVITAVKRLPYLFIGWLWYAITLLPVIGIVQIGNYAMADRYTYLPSIGIFIMLAWGIPFLFRCENIHYKILFPAGITILAIMAVLTWQQCGYWKNSIELFNHALQVTNSAFAHNARGDAYYKLGQYQQAIEDFNQAILLKPYYANAYHSRGTAYAELGQYKRALENFNEAIRLKPDSALAYYSRGTAYAKLGQYQHALENFNEVIRLQPDYAPAYYSRGDVYAELGQQSRAIEDYNKTIKLQPDYAEGCLNRGITYAKLDQQSQAIENYNKTIRLQPDYAVAYNNRGIAYFLQGNNEMGCRDAQKTCALGNCKLLEMAKGKGDCR